MSGQGNILLDISRDLEQGEAGTQTGLSKLSTVDDVVSVLNNDPVFGRSEFHNSRPEMIRDLADILFKHARKEDE